MKRMKHIGLWAITTLAWIGCEKSDFAPEQGNLELNIDRLEALGNNFRYEGWILVNGEPRSTGTFTVDENGHLTKTSFAVDRSELDQATEFMVTIEPNPDSDPAPSTVRLLAGDFDGGSAQLTIGHRAAFGQDFSTAQGNYILAAPTTTATSANELSGVWFLDPNAGPGLVLPALPAGWTYEGWAIINFQPVTTGKFEQANGADQSAPFSGPEPSPAFPGEDFQQNAPDGLTFPANLRNAKIVLTVEPVPDNSPDPFFLKPLFTTVPPNPFDQTLYPMYNQAEITLPTGIASRVSD